VKDLRNSKKKKTPGQFRKGGRTHTQNVLSWCLLEMGEMEMEVVLGQVHRKKFNRHFIA
jgi:hypothetical protein